MNRPNLLALAAAAGTLPLGLVAANLGSAAPRDAVQATPAGFGPPGRCSPRRTRTPSSDAANAFLATLSEKQRAGRPDRAHASPCRPMVKPAGRVQPAQRHLLPGTERNAGRRRPEGRLAWPWARRASPDSRRFAQPTTPSPSRPAADAVPVAEAAADAGLADEVGRGQVPAVRLRAAAFSISPTRTRTAS